jgi:peptidoglycan hydrolase CwlO-like protein
MSATSNPAQSEFSEHSLPVKRQLVEKLAIDPADLKTDQSERPRLNKRVPLALVAITFCIGVVATVVWQSYGDAARGAIASSLPQLGWSVPQAAPVTPNNPDMIAPTASAAPSPDQQQVDAIPLDLDAMRQSVDRISTSITAGQEQIARSVDRMAASQEQITRSIDRIVASQEQLARTVAQLANSQEQVTREITKLQAIEQQHIYRNSKPLASRPAPQTSQGQTAR